MVMQMIHIHRDTNKLCSAVDLDLLEERNFFLNYILGTSLAVQWLRQCFTAGGMGSIPDWKLRSYMPHSMAKKKKKDFIALRTLANFVSIHRFISPFLTAYMYMCLLFQFSLFFN